MSEVFNREVANKVVVSKYRRNINNLLRGSDDSVDVVSFLRGVAGKLEIINEETDLETDSVRVLNVGSTSVHFPVYNGEVVSEYYDLINRADEIYKALDYLIRMQLVLDRDIMSNLKSPSRIVRTSETTSGMLIKINEEVTVSVAELYSSKVLALLVEIGEVANEIRPFKYWSSKSMSDRSIILDELADVLHFLLSMILLRQLLRFSESKSYSGAHDTTTYNLEDLYDVKYLQDKYPLIGRSVPILTYARLFGVDESEGAQDSRARYALHGMYSSNLVTDGTPVDMSDAHEFLDMYIALLDTLGIEFSEVYDAYISKNKVNVERLNGDY